MLTYAQVAELVDAYGLEPYGAICGGSSPLLGTRRDITVIKGAN